MSTYKTTDPAVIAAAEAFFVERSALRKAGAAFCDRFGGAHAMTSNGASTIYFAGLTFSPPKDRRFWTVPEKDGGIQRPRQSVPGLTKEERATHAALRAEWLEHIPEQRVAYEPVYKAIGTSWGDIAFTGIGWFLHDGAVYVKTTAKLSPVMVEILGSEYEAALEAEKAK